MSNDDSYNNDDYKDIIKDIDEGRTQVSKWEADFLDTVLTQDSFSPKQKDVIRNLEKKYLQ